MKPILFMIGPFHVFAFGLILSLLFLVTSFIIWKYAKEELIEEETMDSYVYTVLVSLLSARLVFILFHFHEFGWNILKYLIVREEPGLSLMGGTLGGIVFLFLYSKRKKLSFSKIADIFSLGMCFSISFISLAQFFSGGSYGAATNLPWGVSTIGVAGIRHPVELYGFIAYFILFIILSSLRQKIVRRFPSGTFSLVFLESVSLIVFLLEFFKERSVYLYSGIRFNQVVAGVIVLATLMFIIYRIRKVTKKAIK